MEYQNHLGASSLNYRSILRLYDESVRAKLLMAVGITKPKTIKPQRRFLFFILHPPFRYWIALRLVSDVVELQKTIPGSVSDPSIDGHFTHFINIVLSYALSPLPSSGLGLGTGPGIGSGVGLGTGPGMGSGFGIVHRHWPFAQ